MKNPTYPELTIEDLDIKEYAADSAYEEYTGIVLDPEDQVFKTVSGSFHDKKDFYEKLTKRGFVVRKVFEKRVFDWIEKNAKTTLEAYLMFSTAFSKWKGNNLLDPYYVKLLNDIPQLNREKVKGDPNSIGTQKTEESVLDETWQNINIDGVNDWSRHNVTVIPVNDPSNELEISRVRFDPSIKKAIENYRILNRPTEFRSYLNKYLQTSPEFLRALGKEIDPVNRDTEFKFYDPTKDNKSPLYTGNGKNPTDFYLKIDGNTVTNIDGTPFILNKAGILDWYRALGNENKTVPQMDPKSILNLQQAVTKQNSDTQLLIAAADLEKTLEILDTTEADLTKTKNALKQLAKSDIKSIVNSDGWSKYISQEDHNKAYEFKKDLANFANPDFTKEERYKLYQKYNAENQATAINNLKKQEKDFYSELVNSINIPDSIDSQINWLEEYIDNVMHSDLSDNYTKKERLDKLRQSLANLKKLKDKPEIRGKNKLTTNYSHPDSSPVDAPRTGYIDQPKGAKAKHITTQADLGINQGIHSFGKESTWSNIVNTLKENHIPVVDDQIPAKYVNYGASGTYADLPADGVISNPGSVFKAGGTFISEDQEADPQWDNRAHDTLNQDLFEGNHLRPEVREALLRIAGKFQNTLGLNIDPVDVYFTGSGANFNYNELSDIDLHLVYDFEQIGINAEILVKYFIAKKQVFNNDYDITIKGMPVEVGVENLNEPIVSSAIYSVAKDQWMLEPKDAEHLLPKPDMKQYYEIVQRIEDAIESRNSKKIGDLWDELYRIRKDSLAHDGEYGHGNGLFKKLRNLGYLDRLKHAYYSSASEELSLEALKEII